MSRNRGLTERVRARLEKLTPYVLEITDEKINEHINLAKIELGDRQKDRHDKWTRRIVDRTVARLRASLT